MFGYPDGAFVEANDVFGYPDEAFVEADDPAGYPDSAFVEADDQFLSEMRGFAVQTGKSCPKGGFTAIIPIPHDLWLTVRIKGLESTGYWRTNIVEVV
ncbi:MAG: hypothetical protein LBD79_04660 [Treponema sp.]|nr:hypothetical protein [Treponema sp.]